MFGWNEKPSPPPVPRAIRDTLFGDQPLGQWGSHAGGVWDLFAAALRERGAGHHDEAVAALREVLATADLESRHYLQAWHFLRERGIVPPEDEAKKVLGVVVEVGMPGGLDLLAAYVDGSSRYYNYSGAGVVLDTPTPAIRQLIDGLLAAAAKTVAAIGPWTGPRPPAPVKDHVRLNILTPSGVHFGYAPMVAMQRDPLGGPVFHAAARLLQALTQLPRGQA